METNKETIDALNTLLQGEYMALKASIYLYLR